MKKTIVSTVVTLLIGIKICLGAPNDPKEKFLATELHSEITYSVAINPDINPVLNLGMPDGRDLKERIESGVPEEYDLKSSFNLLLAVSRVYTQSEENKESINILNTASRDAYRNYTRYQRNLGVESFDKEVQQIAQQLHLFALKKIEWIVTVKKEWQECDYFRLRYLSVLRAYADIQQGAQYFRGEWKVLWPVQ